MHENYMILGAAQLEITKEARKKEIDKNSCERLGEHDKGAAQTAKVRTKQKAPPETPHPIKETKPRRNNMNK